MHLRCITLLAAPCRLLPLCLSADAFDPEAWEAAAAAAAAAADAPPTDCAIDAAAATASDTDAFCPDAWEAAAAAAAAAADAEPVPGASAATRTCWVVAELAAALEAAAAAAAADSVTAKRFASSSPERGTAAPVLSVQRLLLLPAAEAGAQLRQLAAPARAGLLLQLCGGYGSRGDAWLLQVLAAVAGQLGLAEMGVLLAALHARRAPPHSCMHVRMHALHACTLSDQAQSVHASGQC